ncbi:hypothetical protein ACUTAH_16550 [Metapseudomonas furukawaii]|uniref:hypothetical protein n=1 Tax=Metapseudomonas furukawaii TaxID=1149133 RepID=UPI004045F58D
MNDNFREVDRQMQRLQRFQQSYEVDKQIEAIQQLNEKIVSSSVNYTNFILAAGYAGFFAFWATLSERIPAGIYALTGLLILLSLVLFIGWEIIKMVWGAVHMRRISTLLAGQKGPHIVAQYEAAYASYQQRTHAVWVFFLVPTVVTGLGAAFALIAFFARDLWKIALG